MRRKNVFNHLVIDAVFSAPLILLGTTKRKRKSAARKWLKVLMYPAKR